MKPIIWVDDGFICCPSPSAAKKILLKPEASLEQIGQSFNYGKSAFLCSGEKNPNNEMCLGKGLIPRVSELAVLGTFLVERTKVVWGPWSG